MTEKPQQTPVGSTSLAPVHLTSAQEELCRRLDELYDPYKPDVKPPSEMFRGAIFASRAECRNNPDWIAQAAHSLREILYPLWSPRHESVPDRKEEVFQRYGSALFDTLIVEVGRVYGRLSNLAHHYSVSVSSEEFELLLADFEVSMGQALTRQLDLHREIDQLIRGGPPSELE